MVSTHLLTVIDRWPAVICSAGGWLVIKCSKEPEILNISIKEDLMKKQACHWMVCDGNCMYPHMPVFILSHMQDFIQQVNQTPTLQQACSVATSC